MENNDNIKLTQLTLLSYQTDLYYTAIWIVSWNKYSFSFRFLCVLRFNENLHQKVIKWKCLETKEKKRRESLMNETWSSFKVYSKKKMKESEGGR